MRSTANLYIYSYIATHKILIIQKNCEYATTFSLDFKMLITTLYPIRGYRNSNKIVICFVAVINNYYRQRNISLSILVALLPVKICNKTIYSNGFMRVFPLIMIEM
jgi:hypothetical protein